MVAVFLFLFTSLGVSGSKVHAQGIPTQIPNETTSEYLTVITTTTTDGTSLTDTIIHGPPVPPPGFDAQRAAVTVTPESAKILTVPAFSWVYGCSAVSGAMIAGYYDRNGFPNMYTGPTNGGVMPLTDSSWPTWSDGYQTYPNNPLIASHKGVDGRTTRGSIDDYWVKYESTAQDPFFGHWTAHTWGSAIGDYMKTSQFAYNNTDGSTNFFNYTSSTAKLTCSAMETLDAGGGKKISTVDGTYGRKLFYQAKGYTVTDCYNQRTDNKVSGGFSLANFRAQIDAGHPVLLNLAGHSIVGVGYDSSSSSTIYIHDTWDSSNHIMTWGGYYSGMQLLSVSVVNLSPLAPTTVPTPISPSGTISDTTPTFKWTKISGATKYQFAVYKGSTLKYTKTISSSACGTSTCSNTPTTPLSYAAHKWRVQAYVGGVWKTYSAYQSFTITNIPTPQSPSGKITDTTPTFKWTKISGATQYQFAVYKGSTPKYTKTVASSACGTSTCSNTPTTTLSAGAYKWKVRAYVGGAWKTYSAYKSFTVTTPSTGFNSQFTSNASGWTPVNGSWSVGSGTYQTLGLSGYNVSSAHSSNYSTLTYQVKMHRDGGCLTCANYLYIRGTPNPITAHPTYGWYKGYRFQYSNDGKFSIYRYDSGVAKSLVYWTDSSSVTSGWNTLKVTINVTNGFCQYFVNGTRVAYGTLSTYTTGQVGFGFYRDTSSGNHLYVDWATLVTTAPTSIVSGEGVQINDSGINLDESGAGSADVAP
jgi:hypothetical protein